MDARCLIYSAGAHFQIACGKLERHFHHAAAELVIRPRRQLTQTDKATKANSTYPNLHPTPLPLSAAPTIRLFFLHHDYLIAAGEDFVASSSCVVL